jgi:exodeoxyribonuclease-5
MRKIMKLTDEQKEVLIGIVDWWKKPTEYLTVGGYAGTGKTTMMAVLRKLLLKHNPKLKVAFCAYTGKASRVLATRLKESRIVQRSDSISTIHSLIYAPMVDTHGSITGWKRKSMLEYDLVIIDEASMVDELLWRDLLEFKIPILAVGDHGQLPPIGASFHLMKNPQLQLNEIHRQAQNNPIIQISMQARTMGIIQVGRFGDAAIKMSRTDYETANQVDEILQNWSTRWLVLAGFNWSRIKLNQQVRGYMGFESESPKVGDYVICLKNNWEKEIYNGMMGKIERIIPLMDDKNTMHWYEAEIMLEDGQMFNGKVSKHQFNQAKVIEEMEGLKGKALGELFDFGYALTVHKAQGSSAEKVLLFEERNKYMSDDEWSRWLYTAVTRAEEELVIVGD